MAHQKSQSKPPRNAPSERFPGRRPRPAEREECSRIWDALDDEHLKVLVFMHRQIAKEAGLVPPNTPLMISDGVF